jgi:hypothetical protein
MLAKHLHRPFFIKPAAFLTEAHKLKSASQMRPPLLKRILRPPS